VSLGNPIALIKLALEKVPAFKYALAVGAVFAVAAIVVSYRVNLLALGICAVAIFILMPVFILLASMATEIEKPNGAAVFKPQTQVLGWFCVVLLIAMALGFFSSLLWQWPLSFAIWLEQAGQGSVKKEISQLRLNRPVGADEWTSYETDYVRLTDLIRDYIRYVEMNPNADRKDEVLGSIKEAVGFVRMQNQKVSEFADKRPNGLDLYTKTFPAKLDHILEVLERAKHNGDGLTREDAVCFDTAIKSWRYGAWFDDNGTKQLLADSGYNGQLPYLTKRCTDYLILGSEGIPH
jgi:hypothetical protein